MFGGILLPVYYTSSFGPKVVMGSQDIFLALTANELKTASKIAASRDSNILSPHLKKGMPYQSLSFQSLHVAKMNAERVQYSRERS